jgi:hypothetical protein
LIYSLAKYSVKNHSKPIVKIFLKKENLKSTSPFVYGAEREYEDIK